VSSRKIVEADVASLTDAQIVDAIVNARAEKHGCSSRSAKGIQLSKDIGILLAVLRARGRRRAK